MPTSVRVSKLLSCDALSNRESHSHLSFLNVIAVTFNVAVTEKIVVSACLHIECTVNSSRRAALGSIEAEIPATTAAVTVVNPDITSIVDVEGGVRIFLHKVTVLKEIERNSIRIAWYFYLLYSIKDLTSVVYISTNSIIQGVLTKKTAFTKG